MTRPVAFFITLVATSNCAHAAMNWSGDVRPGDPAAWTGDTHAYVGYSTPGSLEVTEVDALVSRHLVVGRTTGATGRVHVSGADAAWAGVGFLQVGDGLVEISNGARVSFGQGGVGYSTPSTGRFQVDGIGSTWETLGGIWVGYGGDGFLAITNGGLVDSGSGFIGNGTVVVDGPASTWNLAAKPWPSLGDLYVGRNEGHGFLSITNGATVSSVNGRIAADSQYTSSVVVVHGHESEWIVGGDLTLGGADDGTIYITGGGLVSVAQVLETKPKPHPRIGGDGVVNLATGGMLALAGNAEISLDEFLDLVEGSDTIRYWDNGASDWVDITEGINGEDYTLEYLADGDLAGYTLLTAIGLGPKGDFNGDLKVNGGDFLAWQRGQSPGPPSSADLVDWQAKFGAHPAMAATAATIAEPVGVLLAAVGMCAICLAQAILKTPCEA